MKRAIKRILTVVVGLVTAMCLTVGVFAESYLQTTVIGDAKAISSLSVTSTNASASLSVVSDIPGVAIFPESYSCSLSGTVSGTWTAVLSGYGYGGCYDGVTCPEGYVFTSASCTFVVNGQTVANFAVNV